MREKERGDGIHLISSLNFLFVIMSLLFIGKKRGNSRKNRLFKHVKPGANILQVQSRAHSKTLGSRMRSNGLLGGELSHFEISFFLKKINQNS